MKLDWDMTILVVDDTGFMRKIIADILQKIGFKNIVVAVDGLDAIEKLKEHRVGLIRSDWNIPNMDGLALLKHVRQDEQNKDVLFIMATAQADKTNISIAMEAGANSHIAKPFDEGQIKLKIDEIFGITTETATIQSQPRVVAGKVKMKIGHIQITDHLALGVLNHQINTGEVTPKYFELESLCMAGWNPVQDTLENGQVDGAFVLAPIAMDLFGFGVDIRLILLAHKNGSIFVRSRNTPFLDYASEAEFYKYKAVNIPHKMSIHHLLAHQYLSGLGLKPGVPGAGKAINVRFEVAPPIQMPAIMKENDEVGGFIVAEPIGSSAIKAGIADLQFISSSLWPEHPCCVVAMRNEFIQQYPDAVHEFTALLMQAGKYAEQNKAIAAEIAVPFLDPHKTLGLQQAVIQKVLEDPQGITMRDLYPVLEDLDKIQRYMFDSMGVGKIIDLEKLVDLKFARAAG
ncbi:MAG: ABC transporter substrate-binding protein [Proteobacteria bacterium]|nr:response regulator [Desulfobulbaceae bacterium]MBU4153234.1 ABC transporter substrate-binding protein [Pseudomonadota bacterium]